MTNWGVTFTDHPQRSKGMSTTRTQNGQESGVHQSPVDMGDAARSASAWWFSVTAVCVSTLAFLLAGSVAHAAEKPGSYHKVDRWGFKIRAPKGWTKAAMSSQEKWIAAKFIGSRGLQPKGKSEFYVDERPDMWVIAFPADRDKRRRAKRDKKSKIVKIDNPYRDYKDFLKREKWAATGGFYFSKEEETEVKGVKVSIFEVKVEKNVSAPKRMITWMYHFPQVEFAIQFRILEDHVDSYRQTIDTCLRSIKVTGPAKALRTTTGGSITDQDTKPEREMTPDELRLHRVEKVNALLRQEMAGLEDPWYSMESDNYVALTNADKKFVKRTLAHAEAVRKYLDKTFPSLGKDFVPRGVLRIFATKAEENAFQSGTASVWANEIEQILVTQSVGSDKDFEHRYLGRRLTRQWLNFRNSELYGLMPFWIREGLINHMATARPKGSRIEFRPDEFRVADLRKLVKSDQSIPLKTLMTGETSAFKQLSHITQAGSVVSWMLGKGNRGKTKGAVDKYLTQLVSIVNEEAEKFRQKTKETVKEVIRPGGDREDEDGENGEDGEGEDGEGEDEEEGMSDEDEEELEKAADEFFDEMRNALKERGEAIRKRAFEAAFGSLKDKDWKRIDLLWQKFAG